ncbi:MAG: Gfo/Idh/MocA family oxidoreductase [Dehalococcoidales bacterium]|nr:Gfo/Idh/MocA family oxidoreductase [Dehalococcoidales bacterium]
MKKAARGGIELWAVDIEPQIKLIAPDVAILWQAAQSKSQACYVNKTINKESYERPSNIDYVFIVTPDEYHSEIAEFWLNRLAPKGKIFIEKPLDAFIRSALKLGQIIKEANRDDVVFVYDHYLAKVYPFLQDKSNLDQIGKIERIKFHILESSPIPLNRAKTLNKGVIFDLFGHILALTGAFIERNLAPSKSILQRVKLREVKAARYYDCPIAGETLSQIKFTLDDTEVISLMGKGVAQDDKVMIVYGTNGMLKLDFLNNVSLVFNRQGQQRSPGELNPRHVESFLEEIIDKDKQPISIPGVLDFEAGIETLAILDEAKIRIEKIVDYHAGVSIDSILERL